MASAAILGISTLVSAGAGLYSQKSAENAADAQSKSQQNLLDRRGEDQRVALTENSKRLQRNKLRQLAQVRVAQASSGFNTDGGTPLAVFGDLESQYDDQIDESTNRALDAIGNINMQRESLQFSDKLRSQAGGINRMAIGVNAATSFGAGYKDNYDRSKSDPFNIFK